MKVLVLNGVNLNMLGKRETELYGSETLSDLETRLTSLNKDVDLEFFQSNSEEDIINKIHGGRVGINFLGNFFKDRSRDIGTIITHVFIRLMNHYNARIFWGISGEISRKC